MNPNRMTHRNRRRSFLSHLTSRNKRQSQSTVSCKSEVMSIRILCRSLKAKRLSQPSQHIRNSIHPSTRYCKSFRKKESSSQRIMTM